MSVPCEMLLHPELLTNEQLVFIIQERHLRIPDIEKMPRDELLEVFHHYCVPFGQRKYRDTGRGKILNKIRRMSPEPKPASLHVINCHSFTDNQHRKQLHSNWDRLKPPPDLLSGHMKRIKIENNTIPFIINDVINTKRKMSIDSVPPATDPPPHKKDRKAITWP